jgi:hypothetical protein
LPPRGRSRRDDDDVDEEEDDEEERPRRRRSTGAKGSNDRVTILEGNPARAWLESFGVGSSDDDEDDEEERPKKRTARRGYFDR